MRLYCNRILALTTGRSNSVDSSIRIFDLTHNILVFHIWEASYRLLQTVSYWPEGTVFVTVVDPGVGSKRRSIAVKIATNQYIITPDNGTLTHISRKIGIAEARQLDEWQNRLPKSGESHTFTIVIFMHTQEPDLLQASSASSRSAPSSPRIQ